MLKLKYNCFFKKCLFVNSIIITKADKGETVVIMDAENYVKEAEHRLHNKDVYKKLQNNTAQINTGLLNDTITLFKNDRLVTENMAKWLERQQAETWKFHSWPKIQKGVTPGHPVVSSVNRHINTIYDDFHLQRFVKNFPGKTDSFKN